MPYILQAVKVVYYHEIRRGKQYCQAQAFLAMSQNTEYWLLIGLTLFSRSLDSPLSHLSCRSARVFISKLEYGYS
jgi:hypothetical protein